MIHRLADESRVISYGIEYNGALIRLGSNWAEINNSIHHQIADRHIHAALKLYLFNQLKTVLKLTQADLEVVLK
jgi:hypothetical protein